MPHRFDENYIEEHFNDYCRCCLNNNKGKINKHKKFFENMTLALEFQDAFGIDITDCTDLPSNVCNDCFKMLPKFIAFHKTCLSTHKRLTAIKRNMELKLAKEELIEPIMVDVIETLDDEEDYLLVPIDPTIDKNFQTIAPQHNNAPDQTVNVAAETEIPQKHGIKRDATLDKKPPSTRKRVQCPECGTFVRNLKDHMRIHQSDPYICHLCGKEITMKINMKQHLKTHFNIKDHQCPKCPKAFSSTSALKNHVNIHSDIRNFECNLCDKSFKVRSVLVQHKKIVHFKNAKYTCELCDVEKRFYTFTHYEIHKRTVHAKRLQCDICSAVLKNEKSMATHKLTHGIKIGQPEFVCTVCSKVCTRSNALVQHMRCHSRPSGRGHKTSMKMANKQEIDDNKL